MQAAMIILQNPLIEINYIP